jgi:hypothetical protein
MFGEYANPRPQGEFRQCSCPQIIDLAHVRDQPKRVRPAREDEEWDELLAQSNEAMHRDGSDYLSEFGTGPDFGCVLWEDKP